uniref:Lipocalin n=1 Tax=Rhipicephalus zambeziensis TaxID=60191 RepID=A0A224YDG3_9ACAR
MKGVLFFTASFLFLTMRHVAVLGEDSDKSEKKVLAFEEAFLEDAEYIMDYQNFHIDDNIRNLWCATFRRHGSGPGNLIVKYIYEGQTEMGSADITFSSTGSGKHNEAGVSNATPKKFQVLNTDEEPYILLYANDAECMVVSVPKMKPIGEAGTFRKKGVNKRA